MITKNFRLNALANQYAAALYNHITATSHGDYFMIDAGGELVRVESAGGERRPRPHRRHALEALKEHYPQWESVGIELLSRCVTAAGLTGRGREIWQSMVNDMGATVAGNHVGVRMRNIDLIREVTHAAAGRWPSVLAACISMCRIHRAGMARARPVAVRIAFVSMMAAGSFVSATSAAPVTALT